MAENIRLVIWDLDETLWKGTLTEGGIEFSNTTCEIVKELSRRGIISSICSRNDFESVKSELVRQSLWSYFVFPSINWDAKGPRVASIIRATNLRPETVMFIDDNMMNLREAQHDSPGIQTSLPSILEGILVDPRFNGKADVAMTRLSQYKLLEARHVDEALYRSAGSTNVEFLRSSEIRVSFDFDVEKNIDRAIELVNRTNQLNFTKRTLPEDIDAARLEMQALLRAYDIQAALVHVNDRYGDYGFVGFYAIKTIEGRSDLLHYCFSCRTLGMGIETWVYRNIGRPWIPMVGSVLSDPRDESLSVDWITIGSNQEAKESCVSPARTNAHRLVLRGGCNGLSIAHYFYAVSDEVITEVASVREGVPIRLDHSLFISAGRAGPSAEYLNCAGALGYKENDFKTRIFDDGVNPSLILLDFWTDAEVGVYQHKRYGFLMPFVAPYHFPVKPDGNVLDLPEEFRSEGFAEGHVFYRALAELRENYEYKGVMPEVEFKANLKRIISDIPHKSVVIILAANEKWLNPGNGLIYEYPAHVALNQWITQVVAGFDNIKVLDVRCAFNSERDAETVNHFDRLVYHRLAKRVLSIWNHDWRLRTQCALSNVMTPQC